VESGEEGCDSRMHRRKLKKGKKQVCKEMLIRSANPLNIQLMGKTRWTKGGTKKQVIPENNYWGRASRVVANFPKESNNIDWGRGP